MKGKLGEIYEETGSKVEITGILEIINEILEGVNVVCFFFDTKIIAENINADGKEISNVKWFTCEKILNMVVIAFIVFGKIGLKIENYEYFVPLYLYKGHYQKCKNNSSFFFL